MKRTSIVALIVAGALILVGIITCTVASKKAAKNGVILFTETRGEDAVKTVDLSEKEVSRISLDFTDADVNIYGSSRSSYIEFVNFRETLYSLSVTNTSVSFSEIPDLTSMLRFWENGFSFKGMRYILSPRTYDNSKLKSVNIYLASGYDLTQLGIKADKVTLSVENLHSDADYLIEADEIVMNASQVSSRSALKINSDDGTIPAKTARLNLDSTSFGTVVIRADELNLSGETDGLVSADIVTVKGLIDWKVPHRALSSPYIAEKIHISTSGSLHVNDSAESSPYEYSNLSSDEEAAFTFSIDGGIADIAVGSLTVSEKPAEEKEVSGAVVTEPQN